MILLYSHNNTKQRHEEIEHVSAFLLIFAENNVDLLSKNVLNNEKNSGISVTFLEFCNITKVIKSNKV